MSGLPPQADPARTYAVLVGVDTYISPTLSRLSGPVRDACRHTAWLRARGVPAANIRLLVSPDDRSAPDVARVETEHGLAAREATEAEVWRVLDEEVPRWRGDLLWFAWSGHAILDDQGQQRAFFADARRERLVNLRMGEVELALLHEARFAGIAAKVCVVDACRHFVNVPGTLPERTFGNGVKADRPGRLLGLYATQDGTVAANLGHLRAGLFTSFLLPELERSPGLPPDLAAVLERVKGRMAEADVVQTPFLHERGWDGDRRSSGSRVRLSPAIRTHSEELRRLSGKGKYLTEEHLPFVSPGATHDADPVNLLERLASPRLPAAETDEPAKQGLLLLGAAGVGKTRTCFEVAALARAKDWRVLHVAADADVSTDDVMDAVAEQGPRPVLVVFDYLDSQTHLDLPALADVMRDRVGTDAPLACVASVRPGALHEVERRGSSLIFDRLHLRQDDEHRDAVAQRIFKEVAPRAVDRWGYPAISEVCGNRPIIALLIAREIEARLREGVAVPDFAGLRKGELLYWLRRRTEEDFLPPPAAPGAPAGGAGPSGPETWLLASTVATTACVQDRDTVERVVDGFLTARDDPDFPKDGAGVVGRLLGLGWLLADGEEIDVVHDIVTDELLQQSLVPDHLELRTVTAAALFRALLADLRTFGRFVGHFRRWAADLEEHYHPEVERLCGKWLTGAARDLAGQIAADPEHADALVLSLLSGPPWQSGTAQVWDTVVAPWLERTEAEAPPLVRAFHTEALRNTSGPAQERLLESAFDWLRRHDDAHDVAQYVIGAMLSSPELPADRADQVVEAALAWLAQDGGKEPRDFVVTPLLRRPDLSDGQRDRAVAHALGWLGAHGTALRAQFVLRPLLTRADLSPEQGSRAAEHALGWLVLHGRQPRSDFVLRSLLRRADLRTRQSGRAAEHALGWLAVHGSQPTGDFVLRPLLKRSDLGARQIPRAIGYAMAWLDAHHTTMNAGYVLSALLERPGLAVEHRQTVVDRALAWVRAHPATASTPFVLRSLLELVGMSARRESEVVRHAQEWIGAHWREADAALVLQPLLRRVDLSEKQADSTTGHALAWLGVHGRSAIGYFVLGALLDRHDLGAGGKPGKGKSARAVDHALTWLELHPEVKGIQYVLRPLLRVADMTEEQGARAVTHALRWLALNPTGKSARYSLEPLLFRTDLTEEQSRDAVGHALAWLDLHEVREGARPVLCAVLSRSDLSPEQSGDAAAHALAWLEVHGEQEGARRVHHSLLRRYDLSEDHTEQAVALGLGWLALHGRIERAHSVLAALLVHTEADDDLDDRPLGAAGDAQARRAAQATRTIDHALEWLDAQPADGNASFVLRHLLPHEGMSAQQATAAVDHALVWLDAWGTVENAQFVLRALLSCTRLDSPTCARAIALAFAWLRLHAGLKVSQFVLSTLLGRAELEGDGCSLAVRLTLEWVDAHRADGNATYVLYALLSRTDLDPDTSGRCVAAALTWLEDHAAGGPAQFVVSTMLARTDLAEDHLTAAVGHAWTWLETQAGTEYARFVLHSLLRRDDLDRDATARAIGYALAWLVLWGDGPKASHALEALVGHGGLTEGEAAHVIEVALLWLGVHGVLPRAGYVLVALLSGPRLPDVQAAALVRAALGWLAVATGDDPRREVVRDLLRGYGGLTPE